jgi:hypothetical protein
MLKCCWKRNYPKKGEENGKDWIDDRERRLDSGFAWLWSHFELMMKGEVSESVAK